jgi:hypothetical protein
MAADYIVQATGESTITYQYPMDLSLGEDTIPANTGVTLTGFKLNDQFIDTAQALQNSVLIPLLNGGSIQLTNANKAGSITFSVIRIGANFDSTNSKCDITAIADAQRSIGDSIGATITVAWNFDGKAYSIIFKKCTVVDTPPLKLAGNDAPSYNVTFNYATWDWGQRGA